MSVYPCPCCSKTFSSASGVYGHLHRHRGKRLHKCPQCPPDAEAFDSLAGLRRHRRRVHADSAEKTNQCHQCGRTFERPSQLTYHYQRIHERSRPAVCSEEGCSKSFFKQSDLQIHIDQVHARKKTAECDVCGRKFGHASNLTRHRLTHSRERLYACDICGKRFTQVSGLTKHKRGCRASGVEDATTGRFPCTKCGDQLLTLETLRKHLRRVHQTEEGEVAAEIRRHRVEAAKPKDLRRYYCHICGVNFTERWKIEAHALEAHAGSVMKCRRCESEFPNLSLLAMHSCVIEREHGAATRPNTKIKDATPLPQRHPEVPATGPAPSTLLCSNGDIVICFEGDLEFEPAVLEPLAVEAPPMYHVVVERSGEVDAAETNEPLKANPTIPNPILEEAPKSRSKSDNPTSHACCHCSKTFSRPSSLRQHIASHEGGRLDRLRCDQCSKTFAWRSSLKKHHLSAHQHDDMKPCTKCDRTFASWHLMTVHMRRDHESERTHKCSVCDKTFFKLHDLTTHERVHSGAKPYLCGECDRCFGHSSHLARHVRTVHKGLKGFACPQCDKELTTKVALNGHWKRYHSESQRINQCGVK